LNDGNLECASENNAKILIADGHCDTIHLFCKPKGEYSFHVENNTGHIDLPRLRRGGVNLQCFAVCCVEPRYTPCGALRRTLVLFEHFAREMGNNSNNVAVVKNLDELERTLNGGKLAALLTVEGGEALEGELEVLHCLYHLGMRGMGLTWNHRNELADGVGVGSAAGGLTAFGREVVSEMNKLGIMVDASHLSPRSFYDVLEHSSSPVVVTHANAAGVCNHRRNLDDSQLRALRDQGGTIGICFYPPFTTSAPGVNLDHLLDHFCYIAERFGTGMLALGSDFDGIQETIPGLEDVSHLPALTAGLIKRGFNMEEIRMILGGNFLQVLGKILKEQGT